MSIILHHTTKRGSGVVALMLVHPLGADLRFWDEFVSLWDRPEPIIACDLRAAGQSPHATQPVTPAEHASDIEALRNLLDIDKLVPVGCAIGAMITACYAARYPHRTAGLVLSNPALKTSAQAKAMLAERADLVRAHGMAAILPGAVERAFLAQPRDERYARYHDLFRTQDPAAYALSALAVLDVDITSDLERVQCPTLTIAGAHDVLLPPEQARAVHDLLNNSRLEIEPDAAHFVPFQRPRQFYDLVADFVQHSVLPNLNQS